METQLIEFIKMLVSANIPFNCEVTDVGNNKITYKATNDQYLMVFMFNSKDNLYESWVEPIEK